MVTVLLGSRTLPPLLIVAVVLGPGEPLLGLDGQDGGGQRGLAVVDVADGADVDVNLLRLHGTYLPVASLGRPFG